MWITSTGRKFKQNILMLISIQLYLDDDLLLHKRIIIIGTVRLDTIYGEAKFRMLTHVNIVNLHSAFAEEKLLR